MRMGDGEGALSDALRCRMMRPNWAKACYRQAAAHMLLKVRYASSLPFCSKFFFHIDLHRLSVMSLDLLCRSTNKLVMLSWMRKNWILVMRRLRENYGNLLSPVYLFWVCLPNMILLAKYSFILHNDDKQLHTGQLLQVSL